MSKILPSKLGHRGRVFLALALTISILAGLGLAGQEQVSAQGEVVSIDPAHQEISRGETFTVDVMISGAENLYSYEFTLAFDPDLVEVQDVEDASFLGSTGRDVIEVGPDIGDGSVTFTALTTGDPDGPDDSGTLATVTLKAIGNGTSPLDLQAVSVFSGTEERTPTLEDGSVSTVFAMAIDPQESLVNPGSFSVDVMMMGAADMWAFEFSLSFDPGLLEIDEVELGEEFWADSDRTPVEIVNSVVGGTLNYVVISQPPADEPDASGPDGDGVLATITFNTLDFGESDLDLHDLETFSGLTPETPGDIDGIVHVVRAGVSVLPEASSVSRCDTFQVELVVAGATVEDVTGFDIYLDWDADLFDVLDITYAPYMESTGRTAQELNKDIGDGTLNYAVATIGDDDGPDAPGVLAVVELQAIGVGISDLDLHDVLVSQSGFEVEPAALYDGTAEATKEAVAFEFPNTIGDQVAGVPFMVTITAVNEDGDPADHFSGMVSLTDTTGTLTPAVVEFEDGTPQITAPMTITKADEDIVITAEGTNPCGVTIDGDSNAFTVEPDVESPDPDTAVLTPDPETVIAGHSVTYTLMIDDIYGNAFHAEDMATFSIDTEAGGSFDGNVYTSEFAGTWTVTADYLTVSEEATLTVEPDVENPAFVTIEPAEVTLKIGDCQLFTLTAEDAYGNAFDVTDDDDTTFEVDGGGTMDGNEFCSDAAGEWTVTGTYLTVSDDAMVTVELYHMFLPIVARSFGF